MPYLAISFAPGCTVLTYFHLSSSGPFCVPSVLTARTTYPFQLSNMSAMQIVVKSTIWELTLDVCSSDTIAAVKRKVEQEKAIPPDRQRLLLLDRPLDDSHTLANCGIQNAMTLRLVELKSGYTKIHEAAATGNLDEMQRLVKTADIEEKDDEGRTALFYAAREGHIEIVQLLLVRSQDHSAGAVV